MNMLVRVACWHRVVSVLIGNWLVDYVCAALWNHALVNFGEPPVSNKHCEISGFLVICMDDYHKLSISLEFSSIFDENFLRLHFQGDANIFGSRKISEFYPFQKQCTQDIFIYKKAY
jgi:hypothetical protein